MVSENTSTNVLMSLPEAMSDLRISRSTLWRLAKDGKLPIVKIGRRSLIRRTDLARFTATLS